MTVAEASSYQRLREYLAYLGMTAAAEHLSLELKRALKDKLSPTQVRVGSGGHLACGSPT